MKKIIVVTLFVTTGLSISAQTGNGTKSKPKSHSGGITISSDKSVPNPNGTTGSGTDQSMNGQVNSGTTTGGTGNHGKTKNTMHKSTKSNRTKSLKSGASTNLSPIAKPVQK